MNSSYAYTLSSEEYLRALAYKTSTVHSWPFRAASLLGTTVLGGAFGFLVAASYGQRTVSAQWVFWGAIAGILAASLVGLLARVSFARSVRRSNHMTRSAHCLSLFDDGLSIKSDEMDVFYRWNALSRIEQRAGLVYLHLDNLHFVPIPAAALGSEEQRGEFVTYVSERISKHLPGQQSVAPAEVHASQDMPAAGAAASTPRVGIWRRLGDGFRLVFLRDVPAERMSATWTTIAAFGVAGALVPSVPALWSNPLSGEWNWFAIPGAVFHIALLLIAAAAAAAVLGRREEAPRILFAGVLAALVLDAVFALLATGAAIAPRMRPLTWSFGWIPGLWLALAVATYAARQTPPSIRRFGALVISLILVAYPLANVYRGQSVWQAPYEPEDGQSSQARSVAGEDAFYKQPTLLAQELQAIQPGTKGVIDLFFVGMAGYASQDVFMREVNSVADMFRKRFGTDGRTVRLINNSRTLLEIPLASKTSLKQALKRIAEVMDKDEDILVLFMTSHGSEKHVFTLQLWPMTFHDVDPGTLRKLLDDSGIRNRVVIISACYSGGFVKPLESPDTLVITASSPQKNSFGCTNEAEWTYFGKAYFDDALRQTRSFTAAFRAAKPAIEAREKSEGYEHSDPQMSMGASIGRRLDQFQAQQDGAVIAAETAAPAPARPSLKDPYEEYVGLVYTDDYLDELLAACRQSMGLGSPDEAVRSNPGSFDGMEKSPRHWKRLKTSWNSYAENACTQSLDRSLVRRLHLDNLRRVMSREEVEAAIRLISTPDARAWMDKDREASRRHQLELARSQTAISNELYQKFRKEQDEIFKEFRQGRN